MVSFYYKGNIQINQIKISAEFPTYPLSLEPMKNWVSAIIGINFLIFCPFSNQAPGQVQIGPDRNTLTLPVDIPIFLAGNFGEPRANHFHSGIDIKTNGATGIPVRSVSDGYVSRIKVEPGGYGKALYIRHPNGYTSLYGHLLSYNDQISQYVKSEQYRRESFAVDLFPDPSLLVVRKGQIVALSGNSGSSEGPHLHFELRESQSENPVNPLAGAISLKDNQAPVIAKVFIYSLLEHHERIRPVAVPMARSGGTYGPAAQGPVPMDVLSGIGIETYDLINGSDNHCGVYSIKGYLDDALFFESCLDEISFAETRYMNSFMDYKSYMATRKPILKLYIDPNNQASIYRFARNRGRIDLKTRTTGKIRIVVEDASGNESVAVFNIRKDPAKFVHDLDFMPDFNTFFNFEEANNFKAAGIEVNLPAGALYDDIYFKYTVTPGGPGQYSPLHHVHQEDVPLHLYYRLAIDAVSLPEKLRNKATIAQQQGNHSYSSLGGTWEGDRLVTRTRNFGTFCIMTDTTKPEISPKNFTSGAELKTLNIIRFTVSDDFSGIQSYRGEIDGKWILLDYDSKSRTLEYQWDPKLIKSGIQHRMVIRATDQLGNSKSISYTFFR
jgi:hypothetical protein